MKPLFIYFSYEVLRMKRILIRECIVASFLLLCLGACFLNPLELMHREIGQAIEPLIPQLLKSNKADKKLVLAVAGFKEIYSGRPLKVSAVIEEELATRLVPLPNFDIVEHRKISEIEDELIKQYDLIYDEETTRKVGQLVGADAILSGTIDDHGSTVTVYARIIDIEKGYVLATATVTINKLGLPAEAWQPKVPVLPAVVNAAPEKQTLPERLTFGITPYLSQEKLEETFQPILTYLQAETGIEMKLVIVSDYGKLAERMKTNDIDIGVFSPFAYVEGVKKSGVRIFASQLINGRPTYQGWIITKKGSGINTLSDLKNKSFAFVDPKSTSGYIYPRVMLIENGYNPAVFFKNTMFAGSHDNALQVVMSGRCDAGAVFEDVVDRRSLEKLNVIAKTDKIPYDAYTVRQGISQVVIDILQKKMISLDQHTMVNEKPVLGGQLNGFVIARDSNYDSVRKMASFRADRPNLAIMSFKEIGQFDEPLAETACELLKNDLFSKNNYNIITAMESPAMAALNATGNSQVLSETLLSDLAKEDIQFVISGSVIHLGKNLNVAVKIHKVPTGAIESAFTKSGGPQAIESMVASLVNEINDVTPVTGYVITVDGTTFITDFGSDNGVSVGDRILVYQDGKPLVNPLTGALLGKKEDVLAEGTVISTTSKVAVCKVTAGKSQLVRFGKRSRSLRKNEASGF